MADDGDLLDRRTLVTGGGAGIGRAICLAFASAGAKIAAFDIDMAGAEETASQARATGVDAIAIGGSVADPGDVQRAVDAVVAEWGGIDILVNNAGVSANSPTLDLSLEAWNRVVDINLNGVFITAQACGRVMILEGKGAIINLGSIYSTVAAPNRLAYCATKAAVAMLTKSLAIEWAKSGIRVNAVAPGYVRTQMVVELEAAGKLDLEAINRRTPQGHIATPEDIAEAVLFLATDKASHITGQVLGVDGGWTAYGFV
ncbi:MAG: SDR family oxidoreductase [Bauldia sp.]|nr:SDR family oxidoreductase [Bauldia sp.]